MLVGLAMSKLKKYQEGVVGKKTAQHFTIIYSLKQQQRKSRREERLSVHKFTVEKEWSVIQVPQRRVGVVRKQPWAGTPQGVMSKEMSDSDSNGPAWVKTVMPRQSPLAKLPWPEKTGKTSQTNSSPMTILRMLNRKEVWGGLIKMSHFYFSNGWGLNVTQSFANVTHSDSGGETVFLKVSRATTKSAILSHTSSHTRVTEF